MRLLHVDKLTKHFYIHQLERSLPVFSDLTFTLSAGQFILITGANGAGKSTLLRCLHRNYRPTAGQAIYESRHGAIDLARAADVDMLQLRKTEIGFVTQFLRARPRVSAFDLVMEPLLHQVSTEEARTQASTLLEQFGLKQELWSAYPTTFSGGEQQKVNLARALIRPRRLLLLDEPTASLDQQARASLVDRLRTLKTEGVAMLGIFHHAEDVKELVDETLEITTTTGLEALNSEASHVAE